MPDKVFHAHHLDFDDQHLETYLELQEEVKEVYEAYLASPTHFNYGCLLVKILRLRQCCNHIDAILSQDLFKLPDNRHDELSSAKFDQIVKIIQHAPDHDKLIVFSQWDHSLKLLGHQLTQSKICYLEYNGSLNISSRNNILEQFSKGESRVLLLTLGSGGIGLNLTCANHVILMDSWWNPALENQAIDRVYRIGQTKSVEVHRLCMKETIEEWMDKIKQEKNTIEHKFHDDNEIYEIDRPMLSKILHQFI
jgi:SNF2 family DNA or RNA helicase